MARTRLSDRSLKALEPAPSGTRYDVMDAEAPGLGVRVNDKGTVSFIYAARFPGAKNYTRREIPLVTSLEQAREVARKWREMIRAGQDPAVEAERARAAAAQRRAVTFAAVAEDWFKDKVAGERKAEEVERTFRKNFIAIWAERPISEITDLDVLAVVRAKKQTAPAQARTLFIDLRRFFNWVIDARVYGLKFSPCDRLKPAKIIGKRKKRQRILNDEELFALWRAIGKERFPFKQVYHLLLLTALRLNEVADASKKEVDWSNDVWVIPSTRMKGEDEEARPHAVPLTRDIRDVLKSLPQFKAGPFLFTCTSGKKSVWIGDLVKRRLDKRMRRTLKALARRNGDDASQVELHHWINHDIRRTVRSNLSRLKVAEEVREAVLAHARPGVVGTYDVHDYLDEKREALELWAARFHSIVEPAPANVVPLRRSAQ